MRTRSLFRDVLLVLGGSLGLYVAMVACSSARDGDSTLATDAGADTGGQVSSGGGGPLDGSAPSDAAGLLDAVSDAVTDFFDVAPDAVPDANAQVPTAVTAECTAVGASGSRYAEAAFPGKTVEELSAVRSYFAEPAPDIAGYTHRMTSIGILVKPGGVAAPCDGSSVTFVLP